MGNPWLDHVKKIRKIPANAKKHLKEILKITS